MKQFGDLSLFSLREIKSQPIQEKELQELRHLSGSYENLFSRRAMKYKSMNLKDKKLNEEDYKNLILKEYTFLKRPVIVIGNEIFVGNSIKVVKGALTKYSSITK